MGHRPKISPGEDRLTYAVAVAIMTVTIGRTTMGTFGNGKALPVPLVKFVKRKIGNLPSFSFQTHRMVFVPRRTNSRRRNYDDKSVSMGLGNYIQKEQTSAVDKVENRGDVK